MLKTLDFIGVSHMGNCFDRDTPSHRMQKLQERLISECFHEILMG